MGELNEDGALAVERPYQQDHLSVMFSDQSNVIGGGTVTGWAVSAAGPVTVTFSQPVSLTVTHSFWSAVYEGTHAATLIYAIPTITESTVLTLGGCFSTVGSYFSESIPMVVDDGRAESEAQEAA